MLVRSLPLRERAGTPPVHEILRRHWTTTLRLRLASVAATYGKPGAVVKGSGKDRTFAAPRDVRRPNQTADCTTVALGCRGNPERSGCTRGPPSARWVQGVSVMSVVEAPQIDPRVEFWSNPQYWPREATGVTFLGRVVQHLGSVMYGQQWTGEEPYTIVSYAIHRQLSAETPKQDIDYACRLLYQRHLSYRQRADLAFEAGEPCPLPVQDEWAIAFALSAQIEDETRSALNRYSSVVRLLVRVFELGIVQTALRPYEAGLLDPLPRGNWFNECYFAWFATCQVHVEFPFNQPPVRYGGRWIYVNTESYLSWLAIAFDTVGQKQAGQPEPKAASEPMSAEPAGTPPDSESESSTHAPDQAPPKPERKKGAPPKYDWPTYESEVMRRARDGEAPTSIHDFADQMAEWCVQVWGKEPGHSTLRHYIRRVLDQNGSDVRRKMQAKAS
jgi:hypothetical protein